MALIGVFDSGVGGLTVLKGLAESYPQHDFIYLADTARLPYGTKSASTISNYLDKNISFLESHKVDLVVVACNSASTVLLQQNKAYNLPVFNVIEPGAVTALKHSESKKIGVLGTRATVQSRAYIQAIHKIDPNAQVHQMPAALLVPLVEEGWVEDPLTTMVVLRYTKPLLDLGVDVLILGCTHYPVLKSVFQKVAGPSFPLVDSPEALKEMLVQKIPSLSEETGKKGLIKIFCTDLTPHLEQLIQNLISPLPMQPVQKVDL
ncbi:glutamate racemase [bacterium]|nr:glutamate racemase [bacterium]